MSKFRVELWRIFKFILITLAVEAVFSPLNSMLVRTLMVNPDIPTGVWLAVFSWGFTIISTPVATLVHSYFTFRATVKWYIAVPGGNAHGVGLKHLPPHSSNEHDRQGNIPLLRRAEGEIPVQKRSDGCGEKEEDPAGGGNPYP